MKFLLFALLIPSLCFSQHKSYKQIREDEKAAQVIADTMQFPVPFEFKYVDTIPMTKTVIYNKCLQWVISLGANVKDFIQIQDSLNGKIVVNNIEAFTEDETMNMTIDVKEGRYRLTFNNFLQMDSRDNKMLIDSLKSSKSLRLDKYYMLQRSSTLFKLLKEYVRKKDDF